MTDKSGWWVKLTDSTGSKEITRVKGVSPRWVRNDAGDCRITVARDDAIHDYARVNAEMRLYRGDPADSGILFWRGFLHSTTPDGEDMTLSGPGVAHLLDEDAPDTPVRYTDQATWEAVEDYWNTYTSASSVTVYQPTPEQIANQDTIQSASTTSEFDAITPSFADDQPIGNNPGPTVLQSVFFSEGEDLSLNGETSDSNASAGTAEVLLSANTSDSASFTLDYDIPEQYVEFSVRFRTPNSSDHEIAATVDGQQIGTFTSYPSSYVGWDSRDNWSGGDLTAGSHTFGFEMVTENSGSVFIDAFVVYDNRFPPNLTNSLNNNGFLEGPELYPATPTVELDNKVVNFNVTKGYLDIVTPDTAGIKKLQVSFDGGSNYEPTNGNEQNTDSVTASPNDPTRDIRGRVELEAYGTRSSPAPTEGFKGGQVDDWDLQADGNDLSVIDDLTLTRSHLENLQELHEYWDATFIVGHEESSLPAISYRYGQDINDVQKQLPGRIDEIDPEVSAEAYANRVDLRGREDNTGTRPRAVVEDSQAINDDPRVITLGPPPLYDLDVVSEGGAVNRARALLRRAQRQGELRGSVDLVLPQQALAGFQYEVDFGNGAQFYTAEEVSVESGRTTLEFTRRSGLASEVDQLRERKAGKDDVK